MLLAYLGLRRIITKNENEYYVSVGLLSYSLFGKQVVNQLITKMIINGIIQLISKEIVEHTDKTNKIRSNEYILNLSKIQIDKVRSKKEEDFYSSIELDHIVKILQSKLKEKLDLLSFYCYLITTITKTGDKTGVGFTSYIKMASDTGICRQTISKYMDLLEKEKIISIYRSTDAVIKDGAIIEIPNTYGDYVNADKINKIGSTYECNYGEKAKVIKSTKASSTRSASAKYRKMVNELQDTGEIIYDYNTMREMYETLVEYNKRYNYDENLYKDLSMFSTYDFYREEGEF